MTESDPNGRADDDGRNRAESPPPKFSPEEEASLLACSDGLRALANTRFSAGDYTAALEKYGSALETCPNYLVGARAVIHANVAACHLRLEAWREASDAAGRAIECVDEALGARARPAVPAEEPGTREGGDAQPIPDNRGSDVVTLVKNEKPAEEKEEEGEEATRLRSIRIKALLRRAAARTALAGWNDLSGAEEDYRALDGMRQLRSADRSLVRRRLAELPGQISAAREREMGEVWGKLRELGDGLLRPFGMSTGDFKMVKDEKSGGYSMNFRPGG